MMKLTRLLATGPVCEGSLPPPDVPTVSGLPTEEGLRYGQLRTESDFLALAQGNVLLIAGGRWMMGNT
jgi:hypothetical protein